MEILIFSHESDMDGLFSAAIGLLRYPQARTVFLGYGKESFETMGHFANTFSASFPSSEKRIIICDLGLNEDQSLIDLCKGFFSKSKDAGCDIVWLDHHYWNEQIKKRVQSFSKLILSPEHEQKCAAELVYQQFAKDRTACKRMAEFAHIVDFRLPGIHDLPPLPEIITYYRSMPDAYSKLQQLIEKASGGIFWDEDLQEEYDNKYLPLKEEALTSALKSLSLHNIGNYIIAIAESPKVIAKSILAEKMFVKKPEAVMAVLFSPDGKISIRRKPGTNIRCDIIASKLNGGGHSYAAGATITRKNGINIQTTDVVQSLQSVIESVHEDK